MSAEDAVDKRDHVTAEALKHLNSASDFKYHKMSQAEVVASMGTNLDRGLSSAEAAARLEKGGRNVLDAEEPETIWEKIKEQFEDLLAQILFGAAIVSFFIAVMGDGEEGLAAYVEPFVILLILALNALVAVYQDMDADSALQALKNMQAEECQVLRDGSWATMDSELLVPGDIVKVKIGDNVPADLRILKLDSVSLQVEEAPLTGESVSVQKTVDKICDSSHDLLQDQRNMLFASTIINYGAATGTVVFTGMQTAIGRVQKEVAEAAEEEEDTPLKQKLDDFGEKLSYAIGVVCLLVWGMNYSKFWDDMHGSAFNGCMYYFKIAIALAVAAIPEGLPAVITTCLALGTRKMAKNNAIVRKLPSVETLGCTTVICSDKTGTLTKNEMVAVKVSVVGSDMELSTYDVEEGENSYDPVGCSVVGDFANDSEASPDVFRSLATGCSYNNAARIDLVDGVFTRVGEPTEAALKVVAEKMCGNPTNQKSAFLFDDSLKSTLSTIATLDFTSQRKAMSTVVSGYKNSKDTLLKGAPDRILEKCTSVNCLDGKKKLGKADRAKLLEQISELAGMGLRCLAVAEIEKAGALSGIDEANKQDLLGDLTKYSSYEQGATFLGVVCIRDPPRDCLQAILDCKTAGIRVIMITGDAKETAVAIAQELNILDGTEPLEQSVFTGTEFQHMSPDQQRAAVDGEGGKVFARVEPSHKRDLVKALIDLGNVVAMTGDGVNDAPALKQAHIGIAMGISGTEVAKSASDMVLADDNFSTIVKAVEEGRSIYSNMKAFIRYLISSNIGEVLSIFFTAILGIPEGFNSVQLLWVNLVTDGPPATALGFNPPDPDVMKKPPRRPDDSLLSTWTLIRYTVVGIYVGFATVAIFVYWFLYAETGDGHTLITFDQLRSWGECPQWTDFKPVNFMDGLDLTENPCLYFTQGKVKASTLSLSVLVVVEMLNALNAISEDSSLLTLNPFVNPWLILAIIWAIALHMVIVYIPMFNTIFSISAINLHEWGLVFAFCSPVILIDEVLKLFGRSLNRRELNRRLSKKKDD